MCPPSSTSEFLSFSDILLILSTLFNRDRRPSIEIGSMGINRYRAGYNLTDNQKEYVEPPFLLYLQVLLPLSYLVGLSISSKRDTMASTL